MWRPRDRERFIGGYDPEREMPDPDRDAGDRWQSDVYRHNARDTRFAYRWNPDRFEERFADRRPDWDRSAQWTRDARDYDRGYEADRRDDRGYDRGFDRGYDRGYEPAYDRGYGRHRDGGYYGREPEFRGGSYGGGHDRYDRGWGMDRGSDFDRGTHFEGEFGRNRSYGRDRGWDSERWDRDRWRRR